MNKLSFSQKLWLPLIASLIALFAISVYDANTVRQIRLEERKTALTGAVEVAVGVTKYYAELAQSGKLSLTDAQKQALDTIKAMRFGKDGYVSVAGEGEVMLMHPIKPELNGKKLTDVKDTAGNSVFVNTAKAAKQPGGGFSNYVWPHVGATESSPKTSYSLNYQPWGWVFTVGTYIDDIDSAFIQALYKAGIILLLITLALFALISLVNRSILRMLGGDPEYATDIANRIASGNLSVQINVPAGDNSSLVYAMKRMRDALAQTIRNIKVAADTISSASRDISAGNVDLSHRTEQQAGSLEETASAMEQLTATVKQNADSAQQASQLAVSASEVAVQGGSVVGQVVQTMGSINDSSRKIVDIISVIDGIAFQTNILALNAAVEAARAGEQGRGFAVVASEVRSLAQRSAAAAKEIKTLIDDSVDKVDSGSKLVAQAGNTMSEVVASVKRVTDIVAEISSASKEQSIGINEVGQAITQMDQTTQQNASLVEQAASTAQSLQDQASTLEALVSQFQIDSSIPSTTSAPARKQPAAPAASARPAPAMAKRTIDVSPATPKVTAAKSSIAIEKKAAPKSPSAPSNESDWETF
ncbi:methyl-accepting chemotaxis protein [Herbaspirillum sp. RTI4]|uniref:methyl-accepting chemotaxis protein n=1 Tax=Herbaspirillum sp. RTI4 TaxID=3048640 RepID=UPI002AB53979|nr:methyl-accepting chemotaxis protein [Herbaspirillum sp. RTI4]MDY7577452.1 methyl-accepting chemotaxis protein [Herbaspirillum sp. RTI4]MEA9981728.1 methyl-accepting chemotaxis protein [Herbaspirillum sp. RTI4]